MEPRDQVPSVGDYIVVQIVGAIPIIGFIMMIVWAIGGPAVPLWKTNYARAYFVFAAIAVGLSIIIGIFLAIIGVTLFDSVSSNYYY